MECKGVYQSKRTGELSFDSLYKIVITHLDPGTFDHLNRITVSKTNILSPEMGVMKTVDSFKTICYTDNKCTIVGDDPQSSSPFPWSNNCIGYCA